MKAKEMPIINDDYREGYNNGKALERQRTKNIIEKMRESALYKNKDEWIDELIFRINK